MFPWEIEQLEGAYVVRVYDKPYVTWIWFGTIIMSLGALIAMFDKRYRTQRLADMKRREKELQA